MMGSGIIGPRGAGGASPLGGGNILFRNFGGFPGKSSEIKGGYRPNASGFKWRGSGKMWGGGGTRCGNFRGGGTGSWSKCPLLSK